MEKTGKGIKGGTYHYMHIDETIFDAAVKAKLALDEKVHLANQDYEMLLTLLMMAVVSGNP